VAAPVAQFLQTAPGPAAVAALHAAAQTLNHVGIFCAVLAIVVLAVFWLRERLLPDRPLQSATWACGYGVPQARMQYTGAGFSVDFAAHFKNIVLMLKRQKAPRAYFPDDSYVVVDCVDAVERRLYAVIAQGDASASELSEKMHEDDPRLAFAVGLAAIVVIAALVVLARGALP
jgi:hydrogenase-4 component B